MKDSMGMHQGAGISINGGQRQDALFSQDQNIVALCIDSYNAEQQDGRLYHQYTKTPLCFFSLIAALEQMESFYDDIRFPFASTKTRSFFVDRKAGQTSGGRGRGSRQNRKIAKEDGEEPILTEYERGDRKKMEALENVIKQRGKDATFIIRVSHRQHSSWQGEVTWIDKKKKEYFRSALELIRLIDGALNDSDGK